MFQKYRYHFLLHLIIFLWGFTGIIGKLLHQDSFIKVWYRLLIAISSLLLYMWFRKIRFAVPRSQWIWVVLVGSVVAAHWLTFYYTIQISTASLAILCLSTTTLHVTWLEPILMKSKFQMRQLLMSLLVIAGIAFVAKDFNGDERNAVAIGLVSAFFAALFSVMNAKLSKSVESISLTLLELCVGLVGITLYLLAIAKPMKAFELSMNDLLWLLFLGIVCTSFAFLTTIEIVKKLGAFTVSLSINLEPVYTILLAIVLLKENELLSKDFYIGAIIIIGVLILNGVLSYFERRKKEIVS